MTTASLDSRWAKPCADVTGLDIVFGSRAMDLMPAYGDIPAGFKTSSNTWVKFQNEWFFAGLKGAKFQVRDGIDLKQALGHLKAIQSSFEPKHEHKEAGVAYLASLWFLGVETNGKTYGA